LTAGVKNVRKIMDLPRKQYNINITLLRACCTSWRENSWHRYGWQRYETKNLSHCHHMYMYIWRHEKWYTSHC